MSEYSEKGREANREKVKRLVNPPASAVDASDWKEDKTGFLHTERKLGNRPISKQNLASGGKAAHKHSGRKPRSLGGGNQIPVAAGPSGVQAPPQSLFSMGAQNSPLIGLKRGGSPNFIKGAIKRPGALHEKLGVPEGEKIPEKKIKKAEHSKSPLLRKEASFAEELKGFRAKGGRVGQNPDISGTRPTGGREAKGEGGGVNPTQENTSTGRYVDSSGRIRGDDDRYKGLDQVKKNRGGSAGKGKMNVNIIITSKPDHAMAAPAGGPTPPPRPPMGAPPMPPQGMPPGGGMPPMPGGAPNMPPPSMGPGAPPPVMPKARGGKTSFPKMRAGSGSGEGRLEKTRAYGV